MLSVFLVIFCVFMRQGLKKNGNHNGYSLCVRPFVRASVCAGYGLET